MGDLARVPTRAQIDGLQREMAALPQAALVTENKWVPAPCGGYLYIRKMALPAGFRGIGKVHKHPHFFTLLSGEMKVWTDQAVRVLHGGDVDEAPAGVKRVLLCITDCVGMNVHWTSTMDLAEIEQELVEDDPGAMYGPGNVLKQPVIEQRKEIPCSSKAA